MIPKVEVLCLHCGKSFLKAPWDIARTKGRNFCSRSCSAAHQKGKQRNPPKSRTCQDCGAIFVCSGAHRSTKYCPKCKGSANWPLVQIPLTRTRRGLRSRTMVDYHNMTIEQICQGPYLRGKHKSHFNIYIRGLSRTWNKDKTLLPCAACGYSKHVELAHIKAVSSFPKDTLLGIVNSPDNVIQLCRNCHWELDNDLLTIEKIHGAAVQTQTGI